MNPPASACLPAVVPSPKEEAASAPGGARASQPITRTARIAGLILALLGCAAFSGHCFYGLSGRAGWSFGDFKCIYAGARCMVLGCNPYDENQLIKTYAAAGGDPSQWYKVRKYNANYLPPAFTLAMPLGILPWETAKVLWLLAIVASFIVGALLTWDLSASYAPITSGALIGIFVAGSANYFRSANAAGLTIGMCTIAVWCFVRERFAIVGVACLAISLAFKPHDSGLIWLWLLLSGASHRRRAIQVFGVVAALTLPAVLWLSLVPATSHWLKDLHANLAGNASHGNDDDPGPQNPEAYSITDIQTVVSIIRDDPHIYNPVAYSVGGGLILVWLVATLKAARSQMMDFLALASGSALSLLPLYHRGYDTRLLLLIFPAMAALCAGRGAVGWLTLPFTIFGVTFTSARLVVALEQTHAECAGLCEEAFTISMHRSIAMAVLIVCAFYLSVYMHRAMSKRSLAGAISTAHHLRSAAAT